MRDSNEVYCFGGSEAGEILARPRMPDWFVLPVLNPHLKALNKMVGSKNILKMSKKEEIYFEVLFR